MVFYFSGTGNSKWVAEQIANKTNDRICDICKVDIPAIQNEQYIGFVFPIYAWGVPEPMLEFVKTLEHTNAFVYSICTCGADAGLALLKLSKMYHLDSSYSVIMPSNYIVGADIEEENIIREKISRAKIQLSKIADEILGMQSVYRVTEGHIPILKSNFATKGFNQFARNTKPFFADENCIGCGVCQKHCPAKTIEIQNVKPVWGKKCYQCMRCINACPKNAIQYGKKTATRRRYLFDDFDENGR